MMKRLYRPTVVLAAATAAAGMAAGFVAPAGGGEGVFRDLTIHFETNVTDGDGEVVILAKAFEGMDRLTVKWPNGRKVIEYKNKRDLADLGTGEVIIESAEPSIDEVLEAFPEGPYQFEAHTVSGGTIYGEVTLEHAILPPPDYTPGDGQSVDANNTVISWAAVPGAAKYFIEIENDDLGVSLTATLTPDMTSFAVPAGFLMTDTEYDLGVGTITGAGNVAVAESSFITMP